MTYILSLILLLISFNSFSKSNIETKLDNVLERLESLENSSQTSSNVLNVDGHFQMRSESAKNRRGTQGQSQSGQIFSRLRLNLRVNEGQKLNYTFTPQATKVFGGVENNSNTSGSTNHSEIDFYEARLNYNISDKLELRIGRQELSYGDQLILGSLPWDNNGRSFDAFKFKLKEDKYWVDFFWSKISDTSDGSATSEVTLEDTNDTDLYGIYSSFNTGGVFNELDIYLLHLRDRSTAPSLDVSTLGTRFKGSSNSFTYRFEGAIQSVTNTEDPDDDEDEAFHLNLEVGQKFNKYSYSFEVSEVGEGYIQMYPTAHLFFGFADVLGRRNLRHLALHLKSKPSDKLGVNLSFHDFKRRSTDHEAYGLIGNGLGNSNDEADIGQEIDLIVNYFFQPKLRLQLGFAYFTPGEYLKQTNGDDEETQFLYAMINSKF